MKTSLKALLAGVAGIALAGSAAAQGTPHIGAFGEPGCTGIVDSTARLGEFIAVKISAAANPACTDFLFDLRATGGQSVGGADIGGPGGWSLAPNWATGQLPSDTTFVYAIFPPQAGSPANVIGVDSDFATNQDWAATAIQTLGNSFPSTYAAGATGIDLTLSGNASPYSVRLAGRSGANTAGFPRGAAGGIELAFAPLAEVNTTDLVGGAGCLAGGAVESADSANAGGGAIIGYNVYRIPDAGPVPTASDFYNASLNTNAADGWQYFIPLTSGFTMGTSDTNPGGAGTPAPTDLAGTDLGGLQNLDGVMYNGDEVVIFQDAGSNSPAGGGAAVPRPTGTAPVAGTFYWYAFQPVLCGNMADFGATRGFGPGGTSFVGEHRVNLDADAAFEGMDLDLDGNIEFFSPQNEFSLPGLGLTYNGLPALTAPVRGSVNPAAAGGAISLTGTALGNDLNLQFTSGLEAGNVLGYNLYRVSGASRVRVNEQPILAQGNDANVYQVVDTVTATTRGRGATAQYMIEIVYSDGTPSREVGPFEVGLTPQPARRRR